jgi:muconolactone delta-isomerase
MLLPTPARKPTPKTTSFDQGSHHELRVSLPMAKYATAQIAPDNAHPQPSIEP